MSKKYFWHQDDEQTVRHFTALIEKYGIDIRSLDWQSRESQELRFSILFQVGQLNGSSVLDVGCGMGDFWGWLKEAGVNVQYTGIDITPKMIEIARQKFPEVHFEIRNLLEEETNCLERYDFIFASGLFYYRRENPFCFLKAMIKKMFCACRKAVAFNSLSAWAHEQEPDEFYADPLATVKFCHALTPWVVLRHDYHPRDFTIYMYKRR